MQQGVWVPGNLYRCFQVVPSPPPRRLNSKKLGGSLQSLWRPQAGMNLELAQHCYVTEWLASLKVLSKTYSSEGWAARAQLSVDYRAAWVRFPGQPLHLCFKVICCTPDLPVFTLFESQLATVRLHRRWRHPWIGSNIVMWLNASMLMAVFGHEAMNSQMAWKEENRKWLEHGWWNREGLRVPNKVHSSNIERGE